MRCPMPCSDWTVDQVSAAELCSVVVLYASAYGNTAALAQAISRGITKSGVGVQTLNLEQCRCDAQPTGHVVIPLHSSSRSSIATRAQHRWLNGCSASIVVAADAVFLYKHLIIQMPTDKSCLPHVCSIAEVEEAVSSAAGFVIGSPTLGGHMPTQVCLGICSSFRLSFGMRNAASNKKLVFDQPGRTPLMRSVTCTIPPCACLIHPSMPQLQKCRRR